MGKFFKDRYSQHCYFSFILVSGDPSTNAKLFANDSFLFSVLHDINISVTHLNYDLRKIRNRAFQSKMNFHPDTSKQTLKDKPLFFLL